MGEAIEGRKSAIEEELGRVDAYERERAEQWTCALEGEAMSLVRTSSSDIDRLLTDRRSENLIDKG